MDSPPAKRRKTSPAILVPADASNTQRSPTNYNGQQTTPSRASFMSPTKASLARFNPDLLPKELPAEVRGNQPAPANSSGPKSQRRLNPLALRQTTPLDSDGRRTTSPTRQVRGASVSPGRAIFPPEGGISANPRRRSHTSGRRSSPLKTPSVYSTTTGAVPASPPEAANEVEILAGDIVNKQLEHELQANAELEAGRVAVFTVPVTAQVEDGEIDLPPTPTQLGLERAPDPPKGLLYSSPSRRAQRRKGGHVKSSPLKPRDAPPDDVANVDTQSTVRNSRVEAEVRDSRLATESEENTMVLEKTRERYRLLMQLSGLQADVTKLEAAVDGTRNPAAAGLPTQEMPDELLLILTSDNPLHRPLPLEPKPLSVLHRLSLFLPFSRKPAPTPKVPTLTSPPPSHEPLSLLDPMPYLRAFTPLVVTSSDALMPSTVADGPLLQHQTITLASPQNVLVTNILVVVNTSTQAVTDLTLTTISTWADQELGEWIRKRTASADIASIGWAIGRYWEVATTRAKCWTRCEAEFGDLLLSSGINFNKSLAQGRGKNRPPKRRGRRKSDTVTETLDANSEQNKDSETSNQRISRRDLVLHSGRQSLLFSLSGVSLLLSWHLDFDWTGEVESRVSACAAFPEAWKNADERASLGKIDELFLRLVVERGVFDAVRIVIGLLFPD